MELQVFLQVRERDFEEAPLPSKKDLDFSLKGMNIWLGKANEITFHYCMFIDTFVKENRV